MYDRTGRKVGSAVEDAMDLGRRYDEDPEEFRRLQRVTLEIVPERVFESLD